MERRDKYQLRADVLAALSQHIMTGQGNEMTTAQIARAIGVKPSTWLRNVLFAMWQLHYLDVKEQPHWSRNSIKFLWRLGEVSPYLLLEVRPARPGKGY